VPVVAAPHVVRQRRRRHVNADTAAESREGLKRPHVRSTKVREELLHQHRFRRRPRRRIAGTHFGAKAVQRARSDRIVFHKYLFLFKQRAVRQLLVHFYDKPLAFQGNRRALQPRAMPKLRIAQDVFVGGFDLNA